MGVEEALEFVDNLVFLKTGGHLDKTQRIILRNLWEDEKRTYQDIANNRGYTEAHLKAVGAGLWHLLSDVLGEKVSKSTFQGVVQGFRTTQQAAKLNYSDTSNKAPISISVAQVLHISDLQFGTTDNARTWYAQLAEDLRYELHCSHLDALIISGDIASKSTPDEYAAAQLFINRLSQEFQLESQQIIIVPGNHDVNWKLSEAAYTRFRRQDYIGQFDENDIIAIDEFIEVKNPEKYKERFANFSRFYEAIKGDIYPLDYAQQYSLQHLPEQNLLVLGLNSAWQIDHHYKVRASINAEAVSNALSLIRRNPAYEHCLKIAVWHHSLNSTFGDRITDYGVMERLAAADFRLVLHGSIHKADNASYYYDYSIAGKQIDIIGAGIFGVLEGQQLSGYPWQYNLLKIEQSKVTIETRRRDEVNGAWKPDVRWMKVTESAPLAHYLIELETTKKIQDNKFVGREDAIEELQKFVHEGAKVILIQGEGGVGKTALARKYFKTQKFNFVLELSMATEIQNLTPVENVVEEWLRRYFNEEPGRDFGISLERLLRKLRDPKYQIGIFIDNVETALDKNGKFIDTRRPYVELLRVLADSRVHSLTLITSREFLYEENIDIRVYTLEGLDEKAWREFFETHNLNCTISLISTICKSFGGNAKAMQIVCGAIITDFNGDVNAYWEESKNNLLVERELNELVSSQFNRLENINLNAYQLLCRLGCYRYQDIATIPINGVLCLLWDVPKSQHQQVIDELVNRSLLECHDREYFLHPVIITEASARLRGSQYFRSTHTHAAEFWTNSVEHVETLNDILWYVEACYHYHQSNNLELVEQMQRKCRQFIQSFSRTINPEQFDKVQQAINFYEEVISQYLNYLLSLNISPKIVSIGSDIELTFHLNLPDTEHNLSYNLEISQHEAIGNELNIFLTAPGFQFNGDNTTSLPIDPDTANIIQTATFNLIALRPGKMKIKAELYCGETYKTTLETEVEVTAFEETELRSLIAARSRPVPQPDIILQVRTTWNADISACTFNYHIDSYQPRLLFADNVDYNSQSLSNTWVERSHSLLKATLEEAATSLREDFRSRLVSLGQYLFQSLLPEELQNTFRTIASFNQPFSLLILADQDAWFPWELLHDGQKFLGDRFIIGRWLWELEKARPYEFPVGAVNVAHYASVEQPELWTELLHSSGAPPPIPMQAGIFNDITLFESIRGLHLIRYGQSVDTTNRQDAPVRVNSSGDIQDIEREVQPAKLSLRRNHPLVSLSYLNAGQPELTALEQTWASTFVRAGCSAFVGSLWAVQPNVEAAFVSAFYHSIWAGQTLGVAFQTARRLAKTVVPESLDWLAYVLFGDPMARPYRPVQGQGYAVVEPIGQEIDDPVFPGSTVRFRVSLRRTPPVWYENRLMEVAEDLSFDDLRVFIVTSGLQVTPGDSILMTRTATGDYLGWFTLTAPAEMETRSVLVQVYFEDGVEPVHNLRFALNIVKQDGEAQ